MRSGTSQSFQLDWNRPESLLVGHVVSGGAALRVCKEESLRIAKPGPLVPVLGSERRVKGVSWGAGGVPETEPSRAENVNA